MLKQKENNDIYEREYTRTKHSELSKPKLIAEFSGLQHLYFGTTLPILLAGL